MTAQFERQLTSPPAAGDGSSGGAGWSARARGPATRRSDILDWEDKLLARATATFAVMKEPSEPAD